MKASLATAILGAACSAPTVLAQYNQTGPFYLRVSSTNSSLDGNYLGACHAGAAIEGLCLAGKTINKDGPTGDNYVSWYLNYTTYEGQTEVPTAGFLTWNLPFSDPNGTLTQASQVVNFVYDPSSNLAVPTVEFGYGGQNVGFNGTKLYVNQYYDDSTFVPGEFPQGIPTVQMQKWHVCWNRVGTGYYYQSLAWVTVGKAQNPTCHEVTVDQVFPKA